MTNKEKKKKEKDNKEMFCYNEKTGRKKQSQKFRGGARLTASLYNQ